MLSDETIGLKCIREECGKESFGNWFCRYHVLMKEAAYGIYDIETKEPGSHFYKWGIERVKKFIGEC